ncbi:MAG: PilN domain-containing protein [Gemmatimonadetes bacterium]|nr:PilN domain-containing protein [Gemmatimonadota bacterium]
MIEVNLLPGATKRPSRRTRSLALPRPGRLPEFDRRLAFVIGAWALALLLGGWMQYSASSRKAELELRIDAEAQDSAHYATIIKANARLTARRDTIARKLELIQQIDAGRYVWAHILDEISRALPPYTWLTNIYYVEPDTTAAQPTPTFRIEGRTGSNLSLTQLMRDLEASPFIRNVTLVGTEGVTEAGKFVHSFILEAQYEVPPPDAIETVSLFKPED